MRIQNNVPALNAHRYYGINQAGVTKSIAKLSSGYRINSAADDAAGLAISEKMRAQIRGLTMASKNTQDATSLIQTAEGGMQEIDNMLQRIRELVVYASNDTQEQNALGTSDRQKIQDEISQLAQEIDAMANRVEFNKKTLLNGSQEATPKDGTVTTSLVDAKTGLLAAKENYLLAESSVKIAKESLQKARDTFSNVLWDTDVSEALKQLENSGDSSVADAAAALMSAISALGKTSVLESVTTTDVIASAGTVGADVAALDGLYTALSGAVSGSSIVTSEADMYAATVGAAVSSTGSLEAARSAWETAIQTVDDAVNGGGSYVGVGLVDMASELGAAQSSLITAQALYDAADKNPALYFQIGANASQGIEVSIGSMDTKKLGIGAGDGSGTTISVLNISGRNINPLLDRLDTALSYVTTERSKLGAVQNRLEYTQNSLDISAENLTNAESRIRDVDMAKEMTQFTKMNILFQASTAMLAQANALPQGVLQMLG